MDSAARRLDPWLYLAITQLGWFACVIGGARGAGWIGASVAAAAVAWHLARAHDWQREGRLLAVAVAGGWLWECALVQGGLLVYPGEPAWAPYWMAALWALFAIQVNVLFGWLRSRLWLAAALGAVAGPLSFQAGAALGAVFFPDRGLALAVLAAGWTLLLPALLLLARRWDGITAPPAPALAPQRFSNR